MSIKIETYICVANCPELDIDNSSHCTCVVSNEEEKFNMYNNECPCGNNTKWIKL